MAKKRKWMKSIIHSPMGSWILAFILITISKLIWLTVKKTHVNPPRHLCKQKPIDPVIIIHWHEFIPYTLMSAPPLLSPLISSHADARIIGKASWFVGMRPIWGSSNRNPMTSLRQLKSAIDKGRLVLITPDGPRGPARKMALGPVALAQLTSRPILLCACHASSCWRLRSWDSTQIPKPFSHVTIFWSDEIMIERTKDKNRQIKLQQTLEDELIAFSARADKGGK